MTPARRLACAPTLAGIIVVACLINAAPVEGQDSSQRRGAHELRLVSRGIGDVAASGPSRAPALSSDDRFVAYWSVADNLVAGDGNGRADVFRYDNGSGNTRVVSVTSDGATPDGDSRYPAISARGRYVAYESDAADLPGGDEPTRAFDVYRYDVATDTTMLISRPSLRGRHYAGSTSASISASGRWIAYASASGRIVGRDTNRGSDVFLFDTSTKQAIRVARDPDGSQRRGESLDPSLSANGRYVTYTYEPPHPAAQRDGRRLTSSIWRYDVATGTTILVSRSTSGVRGSGASSQSAVTGNGRLIVYRSAAGNLVQHDTNGHADIFLFDARTRRTTLVTYADGGGPADGASSAPTISRDGRFVAFQSTASNVSPDREGDGTNVYSQFLETGITVLMSDSVTAQRPNGSSTSPSVADNGSVGFQSRATNFAAGDTRVLDIFRFAWA